MAYVRFAFGFSNGMGTAIGFLPHIFVLVIILMSGVDLSRAAPLIMFTLGAKILGEWFFWGKFLPSRLDSVPSLKNWRSFFQDSLLTRPAVNRALLSILIDFTADASLIYMALKTPIAPAWIFLAFVGCQTLAAPIHGIFSDYFGKRNVLISLIITVLAVMVAAEVNSGRADGPFINFFELQHFAASTQMFIVLCGKCLLTGTTVLSKAKIADCILTETEGKFSRT